MFPALPVGGQPLGRLSGSGCIGGILCRPLCGAGIPVACFLHGGFLGPVGKDDAVAAEAVVGGTFPEIAAVAQHPAAQGVGVPEGLVHIVPDEPALVLGEFLRQTDITFHAAQAVAHIVHVLTQEEGLGRSGFQIFPDLPGLGVHPAFHVADGIKGPVMENALVMDQPSGVMLVEEPAHGQDILPGIALVAAGPDEHGGVVLVPLKHAAGPVHHAVLPLRQAAGNIPAGFHGAQLLPAAVAFQVGFVDHVDAVFIAQVVPQALVGVMAGAHGVDVVAAEHLHGGVHIRRVDGAAFLGVPFVAVHPVEDDALPVQAHDAVHHLEPAESDAVRHHFLHGAVGIVQGQFRPVQGGGGMAPGLDPRQFQGIPGDGTVIQGTALAVCQAQGHAGVRGLPFQFQPGRQGAGGVVRFQARLQPQVGQVYLGFGIEEHRTENAREPEEVLVLDPGGAAPLVHFHAQAVDAVPEAIRQLKVRGGEAVLGIAHKLPVAPQVQGLLHPLEADADPLAPQAFVQGEVQGVAAHGGVVPVDLRRAQGAQAVPGVHGIDVLQLTVALELDMSGGPDGTKAGKVRVLPPEIGRAGGRVGAVGEPPFAVQGLAQAAASGGGFLRCAAAEVVGMGVQTVHRKHGGVGEPAKVRGCDRHENLLRNRSFFDGTRRNTGQDVPLEDHIDEDGGQHDDGRRSRYQVTGRENVRQKTVSADIGRFPVSRHLSPFLML